MRSFPATTTSFYDDYTTDLAIAAEDDLDIGHGHQGRREFNPLFDTSKTSLLVFFMLSFF
jgi:hypothetical protein